MFFDKIFFFDSKYWHLFLLIGYNYFLWQETITLDRKSFSFTGYINIDRKSFPLTGKNIFDRISVHFGEKDLLIVLFDKNLFCLTGNDFLPQEVSYYIVWMINNSFHCIFHNFYKIFHLRWKDFMGTRIPGNIPPFYALILTTNGQIKLQNEPLGVII